jgi:hypothetical protein
MLGGVDFLEYSREVQPILVAAQTKEVIFFGWMPYDGAVKVWFSGIPPPCLGDTTFTILSTA